jgi:hypothetical protein
LAGVETNGACTEEIENGGDAGFESVEVRLRDEKAGDLAFEALAYNCCASDWEPPSVEADIALLYRVLS